jgi:hypothetical protein
MTYLMLSELNSILRSSRGGEEEEAEEEEEGGGGDQKEHKRGFWMRGARMSSAGTSLSACR